ncbi:uncharacterized protein BT62DRAFT_935723 [Guyanagaster necrorhizus]|uniref:Uncharacterized protein n=1 Tax=Guyanagaster necrorhizus TaxID=856835 RepID=A0A9P7VL93_9AGAR|nr:uncharacterized protein BT62DRAFT_935723 [Guyanagaster necrorhizus MCA 3950]KAG7442697.1 hypothetical protein BT62DRAFT_935723 [Guyanagaster necrorhizus MCA 3950]
MQEQSQYAAAAHVPLIKSPSLRVPRPVEMPQDIHPLPDSVTAYFVYPFTLEPHILTVESSRRTTFAAHTARREGFLRARNDEKERRKREALRKIAPGFEPAGSVLVPTKTGSVSNPPSNNTPGPELPSSHQRSNSVMEDLVDKLAALDSKDDSSQ